MQVNFSTESNLQKLFWLFMKHYSCENTELTLVLFILCILLLKLKNETQL